MIAEAPDFTNTTIESTTQETVSVIEQEAEMLPMNESSDDEESVIRFDLNKKIPKFLRFEDEPETTGYYVIAICTASIWTGSVFISAAFLQLANKEAGCVVNDDLKYLSECENLIYGTLRPSSLTLISALITMVGVSTILPIFGSIVDHSRYRRQTGIFSGLLICLSSISSIFLNQKWLLFFVAIHILMICVLQAVNVTSNAYLVDWNLDHKTMTRYQTSFYIGRFISFIASVSVLTGIKLITGIDDVDVARVGMMLSSFMSIVCTMPFIYLFPDREPVSKIPEGQSLLSSGFKSLYKTYRDTIQTRESFKWFLFQMCLSQAALASIAVTSTTFMANALEMDSTEIGYVLGVFAVCSIPGSKIGDWFSRRRTPFVSLKICLFCFCVSLPIGASVLRGPQDIPNMYVFTVIFGSLFGWSLPVSFSGAYSIIPENCRPAEMTGVVIFFTNFLSWCPTLLFTMMNEQGVSMQLSLGTLSVFYLISLFILHYLVEPFDVAVKKAKENLMYSSSSNSIMEVENDKESQIIKDVVDNR